MKSYLTRLLSFPVIYHCSKYGQCLMHAPLTLNLSGQDTPISSFWDPVSLGPRLSLAQESMQPASSPERRAVIMVLGKASQRELSHSWALYSTLVPQVSQRDQILVAHSSIFLDNIAFDFLFPFPVSLPDSPIFLESVSKQTTSTQILAPALLLGELKLARVSCCLIPSTYGNGEIAFS